MTANLLRRGQHWRRQHANQMLTYVAKFEFISPERQTPALLGAGSFTLVAVACCHQQALLDMHDRISDMMTRPTPTGGCLLPDGATVYMRGAVELAESELGEPLVCHMALVALDGSQRVESTLPDPVPDVRGICQRDSQEPFWTHDAREGAMA